MSGFLSFLGRIVRDFVLSLASGLKDPSAPGLVTLLLIIALVVGIIIYFRTAVARRNAILWLRRLILKTDQTNFAEEINGLDYTVHAEAKSEARKQVATAWREYRETLVAHDEGGAVTYRNSVRPSVFFNPEDLHFGPGGWRTIPGLFVSVGLFLTFLGLIAALSSMNFSTPETVQTSLRELLTIASAKFIMSLTGLFCSIIFTVVLRVGMSRVERAAHFLCADIETRLTFISLEDLAVEQLRATREQRDHFRQIGLELVAELSRPLREELPAAISNSMTSAMAPLMQQVGQAGVEGMDEMVKGLSARFSDDVGRALATAGESLVQAGDRIAALSDRMDHSSGRVAMEMDTAVNRLTQAVEELRGAMGATAETTSGAFAQGAEKLFAVMNQTLEGIRDNTGEGARALSAAAADMKQAAQGFRSEMEAASQEGRAAVRDQITAEGAAAAAAIGSAGVAVLDAMGRTTQEISDRTEQLAQKAGQELIAPLDEIAARLAALVAALTEGATGMRRLSDGVRGGAEATEQAASSFRSASQELVAAVAPIRSANERIEVAVTQLKDSTAHAADTVARSSEATARSAAQTLAAAEQALGGQARAIETSLTGLGALLDRMKGQGDRLDDIDDKLGRAFDDYTHRVGAAVESLFGHVRRMQDELAPALDTLRAIVEQAEQFEPQSARRS